jgi:hypothetical protein
MKFLIALSLCAGFILLIRQKLLRVDHSFPLFGAMVLLGFAAVSDRFIDFVAAGLGIIYAPLAVILLAIFIVLASVIVLSIVYSRLRRNLISMVRRMAEIDLDTQELRRENRISGN